jgi:hypothetical protein
MINSDHFNNNNDRHNMIVELWRELRSRLNSPNNNNNIELRVSVRETARTRRVYNHRPTIQYNLQDGLPVDLPLNFESLVNDAINNAIDHFNNIGNSNSQQQGGFTFSNAIY